MAKNTHAKFAIRIANFNILVHAIGKNIKLFTESILNNFLIETSNSYDLTLKVHAKIPSEFIESKEVFKAPYIEEISGNKKEISSHLWSIRKFKNKYIVLSSSLSSLDSPNLALCFDLKSENWNIYSDQQISKINPFEYPMLPLILYYLTLKNDAIMIHASGIKFGENGMLFSGFSGAGKSTIAKICENNSAKIIHDDRLIIRKIENKYCIFNTPVYENDYSKKVVLNNIFLIYHNKQNVSKKLMGVEAITRFMAFCIQHNYDEKIINKMLNVISDITNKIPIHELGFLPDSSVIQYLKENHFE
ncbi:MAG: hypothetical protein HN704_05215 [Bacteroidetes bacterium]|jgi:hypothetical protein|nr:hypothetical protein [Bacteroidota bacterium]MBT6685866.1 hypothetical protein [Bacteroidota bacterium]MBT7144070.1 hypothetical protein [Bacteroidota bacterium]MBT7490992.1 hypothetical protein [Bacteroidota bacterium]